MARFVCTQAIIGPAPLMPTVRCATNERRNQDYRFSSQLLGSRCDPSDRDHLLARAHLHHRDRGSRSAVHSSCGIHVPQVAAGIWALGAENGNRRRSTEWPDGGAWQFERRWRATSGIIVMPEGPENMAQRRSQNSLRLAAKPSFTIFDALHLLLPLVVACGLLRAIGRRLGWALIMAPERSNIEQSTSNFQHRTLNRFRFGFHCFSFHAKLPA